MLESILVGHVVQKITFLSSKKQLFPFSQNSLVSSSQEFPILSSQEFIILWFDCGHHALDWDAAIIALN